MVFYDIRRLGLTIIYISPNKFEMWSTTNKKFALLAELNSLTASSFGFASQVFCVCFLAFLIQDSISEASKPQKRLASETLVLHWNIPTINGRFTLGHLAFDLIAHQSALVPLVLAITTVGTSLDFVFSDHLNRNPIESTLVVIALRVSALPFFRQLEAVITMSVE